ncbi:isopropylmalate isomerase small subunit [compost metagenome]
MIGMPCVTAAAADIAAIMERIERNPDARLHLDLLAGTCDADGLHCAVSLPPKMREAFITGAWDTTGMLLDRFEEVEATAAKLPYVSGF